MELQPWNRSVSLRLKQLSIRSMDWETDLEYSDSMDTDNPSCVCVLARYDSYFGHARWMLGDPCKAGWFGVLCNPSGTHVLGLFPNPRRSGNPLVGEVWKLRGLSKYHTLSDIVLDLVQCII